MVLFNDTETKAPPTLLGTIVKWLFRLTLIAVCLIAFFIGVLNLLHGKGEAQRRGIEGALTDLTGYTTSIGRLNDFKLFPRLIIDADNVTFSQGESNILIAHLDHVRFVAPGAIVLNQSNRFHTFDIQNLKLYEHGMPAVDIEKVGVETGGEDKEARLLMSGTVKKTGPFSFSLGLETLYGTSDISLYVPAENLPFTLKQGKDDFSGYVYAGKNGFVLTGSGQFVAEGDTDQAEPIIVTCLMADLHKKAPEVVLENLLLIDDQAQLARGSGTYSPAGGWNFYLDPTPANGTQPLPTNDLQKDDPCREALPQ